MYVCALFSARYGWWNEQSTDERSFVTALKHIVKANVLAIHEILRVRPDAIFIQSEASEFVHAENPAASKHADFLNARRFLSLDLNYGRQVDSEMYESNDYYDTNEHRVRADGSGVPAGEVFGYDEISRQYHARYRLPIMHTETNIAEGPTGQEAVNWLWKEWANVLRVRNDGVPIVGFTWYSLLDQVDWDIVLREVRGRVNALGLYDLERRPRAVGLAYKRLISDWRGVLPTQSVCLQVPVDMTSAAHVDGR